MSNTDDVNANIKEDKGVFNVKLLSNGRVFHINLEDISEIYFIEDIFSFCLVGKISFYDKGGLAEFLPFTGHENIVIQYGELEVVTIIFNIFNVDSMNPMDKIKSNSMSQIDLFLVDTNYSNLMDKRYNISWTDKRISDIIKDITKNMLSIETFKIFENTREKLSYFFMPYWTPSEAIRWLVERGSGSESKTAGYLYYFNTRGLNLVTINKLFQSTDVEKDENNKIIYYEFFNKDGDKTKTYNTILDWKMDSIDNSAIKQLKGSRVLGYDFLKKKLIDESFTYTDVISKFTMLGKNTLFPDTISSPNDNFVMSGEDDADVIRNIYECDFIKRYSKQLSATITVKGHERRYPGLLTNIKWPSTEMRDQVLNSTLDGKFLIKSVTNHFSGKQDPVFKQKIVLLKNAYTESNDKTLSKSTNTNIKVDSILGKR